MSRNFFRSALFVTAPITGLLMAYAYVRGKEHKVNCPIAFDIDLIQMLIYILLS